MHRLLVCCTAALSLSGCFPYQAASSGSVGCEPRDIVIRDKRVEPGFQGPTRTWTAICGDHQHLCSSAGTPGATACKEVFAREPTDQLDDFRVARGFNPEHDAQTIEAHLRIDVRRSLDLFSIPSIEPDVRVTVRLLSQRNVPCESFLIEANGTTIPNTVLAAHQEGSTHRLEARVGEPLLRELRRPSPTLTLKGCGQSVSLAPQAMTTLSEFVRMYDDLTRTSGGAPTAKE